MTDTTPDNSIRSQAGADDARLNERMQAIMAHKEARPAKGKASASTARPDWLKSKPKGKTADEKPAAKPARPAKRKTSTARPPKNSEESWKLAAEFIAGQQDND